MRLPATFLIIAAGFLETSQVRAADSRSNDARLEKALVGTWQADLHRNPRLQRAFVVFNANGSFRLIGIGERLGAEKRVEAEGRWQLKARELSLTFQKPAGVPAFTGIKKSTIISVDRKKLVVRDEDGVEQMDRSNLPSHLPPQVTTPAKSLSEKDLETVALVWPYPTYPPDAQMHRVEGTGVFELQLDAHGFVSAVEVVKSTGNKPLDDAATTALKHWRLKPGLYQRVTIPMTFTVHGHGRTDHERYPPYHPIFDERSLHY